MSFDNNKHAISSMRVIEVVCKGDHGFLMPTKYCNIEYAKYTTAA